MKKTALLILTALLLMLSVGCTLYEIDEKEDRALEHANEKKFFIFIVFADFSSNFTYDICNFFFIEKNFFNIIVHMFNLPFL